MPCAPFPVLSYLLFLLKFPWGAEAGALVTRLVSAGIGGMGIVAVGISLVTCRHGIACNSEVAKRSLRVSPKSASIRAAVIIKFSQLQGEFGSFLLIGVEVHRS